MYFQNKGTDEWSHVAFKKPRNIWSNDQKRFSLFLFLSLSSDQHSTAQLGLGAARDKQRVEVSEGFICGAAEQGADKGVNTDDLFWR